MPETLVVRTSRLVVYEINLGESVLRLQIEGRYLVVDPVTGQVTGGTISKITNLEYSGDVATGAGRTWSNINLPAADVSVLLGTANWHVPQPASLEFYDAMSALPATTIVSTFTSVANFVQGGTGNDYLFGTDKGDVYLAGLGNDKIYGAGGNDELQGDDGNDSLYGEDGEDVLIGGNGDDRLNGGSGFNTMYGGEGADALTSGDDGSTQDGGAGNDNLLAGAGADDQRGGDGDDYLTGNGGNDTQFGDDGADRLFGGLGDDAQYGGLGDDRLRGGDDADSMVGGEGNDRLDGEAGDDLLEDGLGNDTLNGGDGNDLIFVAGGNDVISGGLGNDQFLFSTESTGAKTIFAFESLVDQVIFTQFSGDVETAYQYFLGQAQEVGRNVVFTDGDLSITFSRTQLSAFSLESFGTPDGSSGGGGGGEIIG